MDILIVDDHPIVQKGLKLLLETEPGWRAIGLAASGAEALRMVRELRPAVAIVDLNLPDINGIEVIEPMKASSPGTRIIILSMHMNDFYVKAARRKGADAYVSKQDAETEIVNAVKTVISGQRYGEIFEGKGSEKPEGGEEAPAPRGDALTEREGEVLLLLANGNQNKDVAQQLGISVRTAEKHRARIMRKLKLKNHAEIIHYAVHNNILKMP